jgi:long-chain acyl-CoA synthetase
VVSNASKIGKFTILPKDFSVETDELTATLKLKRSVSEAKHVKVIEKMYADGSDSMYVQWEE